jgi:hypothetical protein
VMEKLAKELPERIQDPEFATQISAADVWWAQTCLYLIQEVDWKRKFLCRIALTVVTGTGGIKFIKQAKVIALNIPIPFVDHVLGDTTSYFKRLSWEFKMQKPLLPPGTFLFHP